MQPNCNHEDCWDCLELAEACDGISDSIGIGYPIGMFHLIDSNSSEITSSSSYGRYSRMLEDYLIIKTTCSNGSDYMSKSKSCYGDRKELYSYSSDFQSQSSSGWGEWELSVSCSV